MSNTNQETKLNDTGSDRTTACGSAWSWAGYPSGTQVVSREDKRLPHYYVHATAAPDDDRGRYAAAKELEAWLNGGEDPWWIDLLNFDPSTPEIIKLPNGVILRATGPMIDRSPLGHLDWAQDDSEDAQISRGLLIQRLRTKKRI